MKPLLRSEQKIAVDAALQLLQSAPGVLIADDTGFGKSWEALAIAAKLGHPILICCPASLIPLWRAYVRTFHLQAHFISHTALARLKPLRAANLRATHSTLIVDEAHHFVNPATARYRNLALLALHHKTILLTATPFQNKAHDLLHLLAIISADANRYRTQPLRWDTIPALIASTTIARRRPHTRPITRRASLLDINPAPYEALAKLLTFSHEPQQLVQALLLKRALSSHAALEHSVQRLIRFLQECLAQNSLLPRSSFDSDFPDGQTALPFFSTTRELPNDLPARIQRSTELLASLPKPSPHLDLIRALPKPTVIFTCYRHSADDLYTQLYPHHHVILWTGERLISNTWTKITPDHIPLDNAILIATDVANTGINLDAAASLLHLDLPWNPHTTLQREGRITRSTNFTPAIIHTLRPPPLVEGELRLLTINQRKEKLRERYLYDNPLPHAQTSPFDWYEYLSPKIQQLAGLYHYQAPLKDIRFCTDSIRRRAKYAPAGLQITFELILKDLTLFQHPEMTAHLSRLGMNLSTAPYPKFNVLF